MLSSYTIRLIDMPLEKLEADIDLWGLYLLILYILESALSSKVKPQIK